MGKTRKESELTLSRCSRLFSAGMAVFAVVYVGGCAAPIRTTAIRPVPIIETPERLTDGVRLTLGYSVEDRPIEAQVFGDGPDATLFLATIHGNESAGTPLLYELSRYLGSSPGLLGDRRVVLIPIVNPDGYDHRSRYNVNRVDWNRNFPAANRKNGKRYGESALSEPEAVAIASAIRRFRPDRIVTIHQPVACVDFDGPAADLATAMAEACSLSVKRLGLKPGSLGSYAGVTLGIPVVTVELPAGASRMDDEELWRRYGPMLIAAIEYGSK